MAFATVDEPYVMVMFEEGAKLEPDTITVTPTIPVTGLSVIEGATTVRVAVPVCEPVPTFPVTVRVKVPPGVDPEVAMVRSVTVGAEESNGNGTGLARVTVLLVGAPVNDSRMVLGNPVVVEPDDSEIVTL